MDVYYEFMANNGIDPIYKVRYNTSPESNLRLVYSANRVWIQSTDGSVSLVKCRHAPERSMSDDRIKEFRYIKLKSTSMVE